MKLVMRRISFIFIVTAFFCNDGYCQYQQNKFFIAKAGMGQHFAGSVGLNVEAGVKRVSFFVATGYTFGFSEFIREDLPVGITISGTYNWGIGTRYIFPNISKHIRFNTGLYMGWLYNYYDDRIGLGKYDPVVYGGTIFGGVEFYLKQFVVEVNIHYPLLFTILNKMNHPYLPLW